MKVQAKVEGMAEGNSPRLRYHKKQISVLLTIIAMLLMTHSILYARLEIGHLGLIYGLPVTYFIALTSLTLASAILWFCPRKHNGLLCLQLLVFVSALWLIPSITGGSAPFTDHAYRNLGMVDYIVRQGHFDHKVLFYQTWPATFIISAMVVEISSINLESLLPVFPFIMQLLYLLPLYVFLKNTLGETRSKYCWAGLWLFCLANWIAQDYFGPPAIALFLLLGLLALTTSTSIWEKDSRSLALSGLVLLFFSAIAVTHFLTSLAALCILGAICLVRRSQRMAIVVGLCLLLVVGWDLTGAGGYVAKRLVSSSPTQLPSEGFVLNPGHGIIFDPGTIGVREVSGHFVGSESHVAVAIARLAFSAIFAVIGLIGVILACLARRNLSTAVPVLAIALAPLALLPLSINYAGEFTQRLYLFALAPMAYFAVELFEVRKRAVVFIFCLWLVIGNPLHVIAHYGNEAMDYFSPGQVAAIHLFRDKTSTGYVTGGCLGKMENAERYRDISFSKLSLENNAPLIDRASYKGLPHYVALSRQDREYYRFFLGNTQFIDKLELKLNRLAGYNTIYDSGDLKIYVNEYTAAGRK